MKQKTKAHHGLHLVSAEEAAVPAQPQQEAAAPAESDRFVAVLVQYYREVKEELEGLCDEPDQERIMALREKKQAVRGCLDVYGVRVGA